MSTKWVNDLCVLVFFGLFTCLMVYSCNKHSYKPPAEPFLRRANPLQLLREIKTLDELYFAGFFQGTREDYMKQREELLQQYRFRR